MRVLSTVAGTSALQPATALKSSLLPFKDAKADGTSVSYTHLDVYKRQP